jgi:hypothetical protein
VVLVAVSACFTPGRSQKGAHVSASETADKAVFLNSPPVTVGQILATAMKTARMADVSITGLVLSHSPFRRVSDLAPASAITGNAGDQPN